MTTRITQLDDQASEKTTLRVEGSLHREDAAVLEETYANLRAENVENIAIDLSNISFMDSESASVLCRLRKLGVELVGLHFFIQRVIEIAEKSVE
ncbi:MAG TPA: STAS domain-containing protein [Pyrinomonadaceae bacterium]|nr:STAS domain-containing protein [Pyrinomonadaceae bacterium]